MNLRIIYLLIIFSIVETSCKKDDDVTGVNFRQEMRTFVKELSIYSKTNKPDFIIIPQNGQELITNNGETNGDIQTAYINAIDAVGRENLFYGYYADNEPTPKAEKTKLLNLCLLCEQNNIEVLATDYCSTKTKVDNSYKLNEQNNFISFAADQRELNNIPYYPQPIHKENSSNINNITQARNFLYIINSEKFKTKEDFINLISSTNYDLIIMDLFHKNKAFTKTEIAQLKIKKNGAKRLVICYMSIGEAEDYRFYWKEKWENNKPIWLDKENPEWKGNYKVHYWNSDWKKIIYGEGNTYLNLILKADFDGVYLDIIDAFEYYEENK